MPRLVALALVLAWSASSASAVGNLCAAGPNHKPGASLLFPYFEVDAGNPGGATTLISINNARTEPVLSRVVVWTDWGIPVLAFDLLLLGGDIQSLNLRDLLNGRLPATGVGVNLAQWPTCATEPPSGYGDPALSATESQQLRAYLTGVSGPLDPLCAGHPHGDGRARGYVTVDVVKDCRGLELGSPAWTPARVEAAQAYFQDNGGGLADDLPALWGDHFLLDPAENSAQGVEALPLWSDPIEFSSRTRTFYGRYSGYDGRDNRVPLASDWRLRFLSGGGFSGGTDLLVFRDTRSPDISKLPCGPARPSWYPLPSRYVSLDENGVANLSVPSSSAFGLATQRVAIASLDLPAAFGALELRLQLWTPSGVGTRITRYPGWVIPVLKASSRYSVGLNATPAEIDCFGSP